MKTTKKTITFRKTAACPSSATLLSFRTGKVSIEISTLVSYHLDTCEFCQAELRLLAHHRQNTKREEVVPEIPMNLRILAESILNRN
jgi:hypothetical protein